MFWVDSNLVPEFPGHDRTCRPSLRGWLKTIRRRIGISVCRSRPCASNLWAHYDRPSSRYWVVLSWSCTPSTFPKRSSCVYLEGELGPDSPHSLFRCFG